MTEQDCYASLKRSLRRFWVFYLLGALLGLALIVGTILVAVGASTRVLGFIIVIIALGILLMCGFAMLIAMLVQWLYFRDDYEALFVDRS